MYYDKYGLLFRLKGLTYGALYTTKQYKDGEEKSVAGIPEIIRQTEIETFMDNINENTIVFAGLIVDGIRGYQTFDLLHLDVIHNQDSERTVEDFVTDHILNEEWETATNNLFVLAFSHLSQLDKVLKDRPPVLH